MSVYSVAQLLKYEHKCTKPKHTPLQPSTQIYGKEAQNLPPEDKSLTLNEKHNEFIECVVGSFLFYGQAVDPIILHALNTIATEQSKPTKKIDSN